MSQLLTFDQRQNFFFFLMLIPYLQTRRQWGGMSSVYPLLASLLASAFTLITAWVCMCEISWTAYLPTGHYQSMSMSICVEKQLCIYQRRHGLPWHCMCKQPMCLAPRKCGITSITQSPCYEVFFTSLFVRPGTKPRWHCLFSDQVHLNSGLIPIIKCFDRLSL